MTKVSFGENSILVCAKNEKKNENIGRKKTNQIKCVLKIALQFFNNIIIKHFYH